MRTGQLQEASLQQTRGPRFLTRLWVTTFHSESSSTPKSKTKTTIISACLFEYFIYGPGTTPVEQYNVTSSPPSSNPTFLTYFKPSDSWLVTNTSGQVTNAAGYDATGNLSNGSPGTIFGYQGQFQGTPDNSTGWVNMRARWYDTQSGMFTSQDPALTSTDAPYQYANGDPVNNSDPSGTCTSSWSDFSCIANNYVIRLEILAHGGYSMPFSYSSAWGFLVNNHWTDPTQIKWALEAFANFASCNPPNCSNNPSAHIEIKDLSVDSQMWHYATSNTTVGPGLWATPTQYNSAATAHCELALPTSNTAAYEWLGITTIDTLVLAGTVAKQPQFGEPGGGYQYLIPTPSNVGWTLMGATSASVTSG